MVKARAVFNLSVGLGTSQMRFKRQQQALLAFTAANAHALDAMPYEMETLPPPINRQMRAVDTDIRRSELAPDILGVFPRAPLPSLSDNASRAAR